MPVLLVSVVIPYPLNEETLPVGEDGLRTEGGREWLDANPEISTRRVVRAKNSFIVSRVKERRGLA